MSEVVKSNPQRLNEMLNAPSVQKQFEQALGDAKGTFISSLLSIYTSNSQLSKCEPSDLIVEALKAASLKLPIDSNLGLAYIIPYKGKPQFQLGYRGLLQLAIRSGVYKNINADVVYEGELASFDKVSGSIDLSGEKISDKVIGYFAYCSTIYGFEKTIYMTKDEVDKHAKRFSSAYKFRKDSLWHTDFDSMAKKTVLKRLLSVYGQLSIEVQQTLSSEDNVIKQDLERASNVVLNIDENVDEETGEIIEVSETEEKAPY